MDLDSLQQKI